jgi:cytoskeletal protein CcmA (bactofilin family)
MARKDKITAFLGENTLFEGHLSFEGTLQIDGRYKGKISASGNLIIGKKAMVESDIHVSSIIVSGEVHGNVVAEERIEIQVPGKVFGDIQAPEVIIHGGVIFEGNCQTKAVNAPENVKLTLINSEQKDEQDDTHQNQAG